MEFREIPVPSFGTACGEARCCICGEKCVLYWLNDNVWAECKADATCCGGHLCVSHAEAILQRPLTLNDFALEKYLLTAKNETGPVSLVMHCAIDVVVGAAHEAGVTCPDGWCFMWNEYRDLGRKLCRQTPDPYPAARRLVDEAEKLFPNFTNPYAVNRPYS